MLPFGHAAHRRVSIDPDLLQYDEVWAAAGTWNDVFGTYTPGMESTSPLEDWRGVDIGQIRAQLRLPVKERVRVMVEAANVLIGVQDHARRARDPGAG